MENQNLNLLLKILVDEKEKGLKQNLSSLRRMLIFNSADYIILSHTTFEPTDELNLVRKKDT